MTDIEIIDTPRLMPKIRIDNAAKKKLLNQISEESQVIVHCTVTGTIYDSSIRIWKSTFLYPKDSAHRSELIHYENITLYPVWTPITLGQTIIFTLIFSGLPKHCTQFDLIENIPEEGGFVTQNIQRNNSDVYMLDIT